MKRQIKKIRKILKMNLAFDCATGIAIPAVTFIIMIISGLKPSNDIDFMVSFSSLLGLTLPLIIMIIERAAILDNPASAIAVFARTKTGMLVADILTSLFFLKLYNCQGLYDILSLAFIVISALSYVQTTRLFINRELMDGDMKVIRSQLFWLSNKKLTAKVSKELLNQCFFSISNKAKDYIQNGDIVKSEATLNELASFFREYLEKSTIKTKYDESRKFESIFSPEYKPEIFERYRSLANSLINYCNEQDSRGLELINSFISSLLVISISARQVEPLKAISEPFASSNYRCMKYSDFNSASLRANEKAFLLKHIAEKNKKFASKAAIALSDFFVRMMYAESVLTNKQEPLIDLARNIRELSDSINNKANNVLNDNMFAILSYVLVSNRPEQGNYHNMIREYFDNLDCNDITAIYIRLIDPGSRKNENYSCWDYIVRSTNGEEGDIFWSKEDENFEEMYAFLLHNNCARPDILKWDERLSINAKNIARILEDNYGAKDLLEWFISNATNNTH